jgi:uncharacterized protein involved in outer membrane biogenesis
MRRLKKLGIIIGSLILFYTLLGFLILPPIIRMVAEDKLAEQLDRPVKIEDIDLNPYALTLKIEGLHIGRKQGQGAFVSFDEFFANIQFMSVFKKALIVREVRLRQPFINVVRSDTTEYNFSDLIRKFTPAEPKPKEPEKLAESERPFEFSINNIQLLNGHIDILDRVEKTEHHLTDVDMKIPFISNLMYATDIFVQPSFSAMVNETPVLLKGKSKPFADSLESVFETTFNNINLPQYFSYVPVDTGFKIASGFMNIRSQLSFIQYKDRSPKITVSVQMDLKQLNIVDKQGGPIFKMDLLDLIVAPSEVGSGNLMIKKILLHRPQIHMVRYSTGKVNLHTLMPATGKPAKPAKEAEGESRPLSVTVDTIRLNNAAFSLSDRFAQPSPQTDSKSARVKKRTLVKIPVLQINGTKIDTARREVSVGALTTQNGRLAARRNAAGEIDLAMAVPPSNAESAAAPPESQQKGKGWKVRVKRIAFSDYALRWEDLNTPRPVTLDLDPLQLRIDGVSTIPGEQGKVELLCRINRSGNLKIQSEFGLEPLTAATKIALEELQAGWFQPYFTNQVGFLLTDGNVSVNGSATYAPENSGKDGTRFMGDVSLRKVACVDKVMTEKLINWEALDVKGINFHLTPMAVSIDEVNLVKPFARAVMEKNGQINLQTAMQGEAAPSEATPPAEPASAEPSPEDGKSQTVPVEVKRIRVKNGRVDFLDRSVKPNYRIKVSRFGGNVTGLSTVANRPARIHLEGRVDEHAPLIIDGTIKPLAKKPFLDMTFKFSNMDLSPLTPYSGKFVGYAIQKGKLSFDLKYHIDKMQLDASNDVLLDQFTFGNKVVSPEAVDLPVNLAVSLLKDRDGRIKLNLPITGRLDDPEFSIAALLLQVLKNLMVKAATSPFALIGSLVGGGEDLNFLVFDYAETRLTDETRQKLDKLAEALYERPALELELRGFVDPDKDRTHLAEKMFLRLLKSQKLKEMIDDGQPALPVDDIKFDTEEEYQDYLWQAYKAGEFEKPRNLIGLVKKLPFPELEKRLRATIKIAEQDLRLLAQERARQVKGFLLETEKVAPQRLFLIEPDTLQPADVEMAPANRVELSLK